MSRPDNFLSGAERHLRESQTIVTKTDTRGVITYANRAFLDMAGYALEEVMNKSHNIVRHSDMPRCVFKFLWDRIAAGHEVFAYVINRAKNGDHYWVYAHVTPSFDETGKIVGYHSNRRAPRRDAIKLVEPIYKLLLAKEKEHARPKESLAAGEALLLGFLKQKGVDYDRFVHSI